jgi:mono/diheme cytochrome c family protein
MKREIGSSHFQTGMLRAVVIAVIASIAASVALAQLHENTAGKRAPSKYDPLQAAPETARKRANPFAGDARATAAGGKLFEQHCSDCHGRKAGGTRRAPSLLSEEVQQAPPGALFWTLTNGVVRHGMPTWSKLPEPERWQIVTFLQSLTTKPAGRPE